MTLSNSPGVKLLAWTSDAPLNGVEQFRAHSVVGTYKVFGARYAGWNWSNDYGGMSDARDYPNADAAKTAAQADFASRILSALDGGQP